MKYYPLLPLFCSIFVLFFTAKIYYENKKSPVNQAFVILCLAVSFISFTEFMVEQADNVNTARFWIVLSSFRAFTIAFLFNFTLIYTGSKLLKNKLIYILIYMPAAALCTVFIYFNSNIILIKESWGFSTFQGNYDKNYFTAIKFLAIWASFLIYSSFFIVLLYFLKTKDKRIKLQSKYITIALLFPNMIPLIYILAQIQKARVPFVTPLPVTLMALIIGYSIWKHKLFVLNPAATAENIITTMRDALFLVDPDGTIRKINPAVKNMLLYEEKELIGKTIISLFADEEKGAFYNGLSEMIKTGGVHNSENNIVTKYGEKIPALFSCSVLKDDLYNTAGLVCVVKDVSELKKLQEKLIKSEKMSIIGKLSSEFAHEIRNPLNIIVGYSEMLNYKKDLNSEILKEYSRIINKQVDKINNLITNLLLFVRDDDLKSEKTEIISFINEFIKEQNKYGIISNENIILNLETKEEKIEMDIDKIKMRHVLGNLLINSVEAINEISREKGIIIIKIEKTGDSVQIYFYDNGCGIETTNYDDLFEPFKTSTIYGIGFGLAIIQKFIKSHNGRIDVRSEPGNYTEFIITLPVINICQG